MTQDAVLLPKHADRPVHSILLWSVVVLCLTWLVSFHWKRRHMYLHMWNVPGPLNLPFIGFGHRFLVRAEELYDVVLDLQRTYPGGLKAWFGPNLIYFPAKPRHVEAILTSPKCLEKPYFYNFAVETIGNGLLTAPLSVWKVHRKAVSPSFNQKVLDSFVEVFSEKSAVFAEILSKSEGKELDIFHMASTCTLDIIVETAMGVVMDVQRKNLDYARDSDRLMELTYIKIFKIWNHFEFIWRLSSHSREFDTLLKRSNGLIDKIILEKTGAKSKRKSSLDAPITEGKSKKAFLDCIMDTDFTQEELRNEVCVFIAAGTDTTAATLSFFFSVLGIYPDVQQKVYEEVVEIMGTDRYPQPSDLPRMKYTEKVIKETLRFFPVAASFMRYMNDDLDLGDLVLPRGTSVFFGTVFLHRNPEVWEDPLRFDPERFAPGNVEKIPPGAYIPFSLGARNCIGMKYAYMSMKTIIANVVRKVKFRSEYNSVAEIEFKTHIIMRYKGPTKLYAERRNLDDINLDLGDLVLPRGTSVFFGTVFLHRNPEVWEDPLRFDPERFAPGNVEKIPPGAYIPFYLGARNCIGMKYAYMSMKTIIANVVRRVRFRSEYNSVADIEMKTNLILRYKNRTKLYVEKRSSAM